MVEDGNLALGAAGEEAALAVYRRDGYGLVARNWRCSIGELDLVLVRGATLVFCEVKTRRTAALGGPFDAVTPRKQAKVRSVAQAFLGRAGGFPGSIRFDVASVLVGPSGEPVVERFEDAF